ncbi:O-antigen ligase C-terminal domain-containing protein [Ramlibacter sp. USB13]|uniref:O-antigen ligase C-terminal domain-containing protein n=2 Tax=Ramlibacter cellulosilyticus TaxID=2764187 RepID=A0A923SAI1_9BURK|nr:Wzy polymerase domain-containing protein [Ramlibacter cellulosilyticus]MBC5782799.1 O-antigen ligase C-terminal domain-containing protein [Ramlibacter cellulosilyticus]
MASAVCGIALWILAATGASRPRIPRGLAVIAFALVAWAALAHLPVRPEVAMLAGGLLLLVLAAGFAPVPELARGMQAGFLFAAAASAVLGLVQYFGLSPLLAPWSNTAEAGEAYANLRQPNQYATLCWIGGAIVLFGTLRLHRAAAMALLVLLAAGSAASVSRTGLLQGLVLTLLAAWWPGPRRERLQLCAVAAIAYFAATVLLPVALDAATGATPARTLWGRLSGGNPCSSRVVLWSNVLHLIAQKPIAGWGWGELDFAHFTTLYAGPRFCDILDNAHSLPLHVAVELGVPAAVLVCAIAVIWTLRQRPWSEGVPRRQLAWALLALVVLHSLLEYPLWYGPFQVASGAALGWLLVRPQALDAPARPRAPAFALAAVLLAATGYAAWDYTRVSQIYLPPERRVERWADDTLQVARQSWLFRGPARFADLTLDTPGRANAQRMHALALDVLHYSPEPRVIERAIESATLLGRDDEAVALLARYRAAFPSDYEAWRRAQGLAAP